MSTTAEPQKNGTTKQEPTAMQVAVQSAADKIEQAIKECGVVAVRDQPAFLKAIRMAHGIKLIRSLLTQEFVEAHFIPLQNTKLGFLTDKPEGYSWDVVRDVLIEAFLRGFMPVNNEFNIIAKGFYGAKNGFERIVQEWPGVRDLQIDMGVPAMSGDKGALVPCMARWLLDGVEMEYACLPPTEGKFDTRLPVKVNSGMGADAILGKATRKLYARIYSRLSGVAVESIDTEGEAAVVPKEALPALAAPAQDGQRIKMNGKKADAEETPPRSDANGNG